MENHDAHQSGQLRVPDLGLGSSEEVIHYSCVDCEILSPPAESTFTLISARHGWRLHRSRDERSGEFRFEWRCPSCWAGFRKRAGSGSGRR